MTFMERITDGLKLHEVLMLGLGSLMFLVMLTILVIFAVKRRPLKQLLFLFFVPVLMLGWSSMQKIKIDAKGSFELETSINRYANNPTPQNKEEVEELVEDLKDREVEDPEVRRKIAEAEFMIGKPGAALSTLEALPEDKKNDPGAKALKKSIVVSEALKTQLRVVENNPVDSTQIKKLNELNKTAVTLGVRTPVVDSNVRVANSRVMDYRKRNPDVSLKFQ